MATRDKDCFELHGRNDLSVLFKDRIKSGMSEKQAARETILEEHGKLHNDMEGLKKEVVKNYTPKPYSSPDNTKDIEKIKSDYEEKIKSAQIPIPTKEAPADNGEANKNQPAPETGTPEPPKEEPAAATGNQNTVGVRHESLRNISEKIGLKQPERGTFLTPEEQTRRGRMLLQGGADPLKVAEDFKEDGKINADMISVARAHWVNLAKETQAALEKYGKNSPEFAKAKFEMQKWQDEVLKPMGTASGSAFSSLQGEEDLDTGSFVSVSHAVQEATGIEPNKEQEKKIQELTKQNAALQKRAEEAEKLTIETTDKEISKGSKPSTKPKKSHEEYVKERKDSFQAAREALKKLRTGESGVGVSVPLVRELSAVSPHMAKIVKSLIEEGVDRLGDIVDIIHDELSKDMAGLRRRDVLDLVAGDYNKQKEEPTPFNKYADIKKQSKLVKKLEDLQNGLPEDFDPNKPEQSPEVKSLIEQIKKVKKDLAAIGYMKNKPDFQKVVLSPEEKSINRLQKELDDLHQGIAKQKSPNREVADKEKELKEQIKDAREKLGLVPSKMEKPLTEADQKEADDKELEGLQKQFAGKKGNKFTVDEAKSIWDYAKKNYLDKGVSYRDMIKQVSNDLGLSWKQVSEGITSPKTKPISDEMWKKQGELRRSQNATKIWIDQQSRSIYVRKFLQASAAIRGLQVFGHAGVFMGTHAGMTLAQPRTWNHTIPAFFRAYRFAYGNEAAYEKSLAELKSRPLYNRFERMGLKNNPDQVNAEEFQKSQTALGGWLKKVGMQGIKGFNALKVLRQDLAEYHYNKLTDAEKQDDGSVRSIVRLVNNATGATNLKLPEIVNEITFAGGMEAARWGKITRNPMRATAIALKALIHPEKVTTEEKVFSKVWASRVGEQVATYGSLLFANAVIQNIVNPNNPVNIFHPNKKDWLLPKFGDITVDPTSGMIPIINFVKTLAEIPFESSKELHGDTKTQAYGKAVIGRFRGKLAPAYSMIWDMVTQTDYNGNQLPLSNIKPDAKHRNIGWLEYATQRLPIPVAEAFHDMFQSAADNGSSPTETSNILHGLLLAGISGTTGARAAESQKERPSPFTAEDKNDPTFKKILNDWKMELPNTSPTSEVITDEEKGTKKKLSDYPKDVQDNYMKEHKANLKEEIQNVFDNGSVYVKSYKDAEGNHKSEVSLKPPKGDYEEKDVNKLTTDEKAQVLRLAQGKATTKTKKELFVNQ